MQKIQMPPFWERLLKQYVKRTFYADTRKKGFADRDEFTEGDYRFFVKGVRDLNVAFTQERHLLPKNYLNRKDLRSGYLLYFLPVNALKIVSLLSQLPPNQFLTADGGKLKIIDVGSGPGTGMMGVMLYLHQLLKGKKGGKLELQWILVDQNREALKDASELYRESINQLQDSNPGWVIESDFRWVTGNLFSERLSKIVEPQGADIVLALNFLGELPREKRLPLVETLLRDYLNERGRMLIMEPALRSTTRELMSLHDEIVERKSGVVYAPCLHQAGCPMLRANDRDWCHTYIPWERPDWIEKLDRLAAIRKDYLKCSYLLIGKEQVPAHPSLWRVVSGPLNSKGKSERLLCGEAGLPDLLRVTRLDRDQSPANRDFDFLERGEVLEMRKTTRVERTTAIKKIRT